MIEPFSFLFITFMVMLYFCKLLGQQPILYIW